MPVQLTSPRRGGAVVLALGALLAAGKLEAQADVAVTKSGPLSALASETIAYVVTVTNNGPNAATNVVVVDSLPASGTFVGAAPAGARSGRRLVWPTVASLAPGATLTYAVTWTAPPNPPVPLTLRNLAYSTASSVDPVPSNNSSSNPVAIVNTAVTALADLATTKTGPATVNAITNYTYTITTRNNGPSRATAIVVRDTLPPGVTFVTASGGGTLQAGNVVEWPAIATLNSGSSFGRTVTVRSPASGTHLNLAVSSGATLDTIPGNNDGSAANARVITTVNAANVAVTKSGPATVNGGAIFTYTLVIRNTGPGRAVNVVPVDTLPATVTFVSASAGGVLGSGNVVSWPAIASMNNGASTTRTVTVQAPATGPLLNIAAGTSESTDPVPGNNDGSAAAARVTTNVAQADVQATKTGPATVNPNANITYTLTVRNLGPNTAPSVVLTDTLPPGVTFISASNGGTLSGNVVTWPVLGSLANGAARTRTVTVRAPEAGTLVNLAASTAGTTDPNPANNDGSLPAGRVTTTVAGVDVAASKTGPASATLGGPITYTITVRNLGIIPALGVVVSDTLPPGVSFVSATGGGVLAGQVVTWPAIAALAPGASQVFSIAATAASAGAHRNVVASMAGTSDPNPGNNDGSSPAAQVTMLVAGIADVTTSKSGPASVDAGAAFSYVITVRNDGPSAADAVVVTDTLPAGATFLGASGGGTASGNVVTWPAIASLPNGGTASYTVTVSAPPTGTLTNVVASTSVTNDPVPANNDGSSAAARVSTTVVEQADLAVTKTGPATVNAGAGFSYAVAVTNAGPSTAAQVVVVDTLPTGVTFVSASGGGTLAGNVVTWPVISALVAGGAQAYTVNVTAPASGTLLNVAAGTSSTADPNPANNNGSDPASRVTTTVIEQADVAALKAGPATVDAATTFDYTVTVTNAGPSVAANVLVTDTLPAGVTFISATGGGTLAGNVVSWPTITSMAGGASQAYTVTVRAPATGTLLNLVASSSTTADPDPSNNNGSAAGSRVSTTVIERADVVTGKTGPASATAATQFSYVIAVQNNGPSDAAQVVVMDTLPTGATFVSASDGGTLAGRVVTWPAIPVLVNGENRSFTLTVLAPPTGTLLNVVASTSTTGDPDPASNDGSAPGARVTTTIIESADVVTTKTGPGRVNAAETLSYTVTARNLGPSDAAGVVVVDTLPEGTTFQGATGGATVTGREVRWPIVASLLAGDSLTFTVTARAPLRGTITNLAASSAATGDPDAGNNNGTAPGARVVTIVEPIDLAITKLAPPEFRVGTVGSYTLAVSNVGVAPTIAPITITDTLPAGLTWSGAEGAGWSCSPGGQVVTCANPGPLVGGAASSVRLDVNVLPAAGTQVVNSASLATLGDDPSSGNNASSVATAIQAASPLLASKGASRTEVEVGDVVDYTLTVVNQSTAAVPDVRFDDQLPLGFRYQAGSARLNGVPVPDPSGAPGPSMAFTVGSLAGNAEASITYRAVIGPAATAGDAINRARAVSTTTGVESNLAAAEVRIVNTTFSTRGFIVGKIFVDCACDANRTQGPREIGIPGVRVVLQDGTATVTDVEGKFNFYGLSPRMHVVKVDRTTLPPGAQLGVTSSRNVGDGWTRFVDLRNSELTRADFVETSHDPAVLEAVIARRAAGEIYTAIPDSTYARLPSDSLAPASGVTPPDAFQPLLGGLDTPVQEDNAASPVLREPQAGAPGGQASDGGRGPATGLGAGAPGLTMTLQVPASGVPADGVTRIPVAVHVAAGPGDSVLVPEVVTLETTLGRWLVEDADPAVPGVQAALKDGAGMYTLVASPQQGVAEVRATAGGAAQVGTVAFVPVERPLMMAGLVEGRFDLRSLTKGALVPVTPQDGFEQELTDLSVSGDSGLNRAGARAALFLQGKVKGSYLLTLAFDTEKDPEKQFLRDIQPDDFYPVYGDASVKEFGAQTLDRLYVRIDRGRNYFLYGDFVTAPTTQARQLGSYLRSLTGATQRFENKRLQTNVFASRSRITQMVDELPGLGISGPYTLSRPDARLNSERVEVLTRDRNQPSRILKLVPLQRFVDYTLEAFTGRILLRQPLASMDAQLNPQSLRIAYEVELDDAERFWVYGADAQVRLGNVAEVGGSAVSEEDPFNRRRIFSANLSTRLGAGTQLVGEWALTDTDSLASGHAARAELRHHSGRFDANAFAGISDSSFSNPSATFTAGRLELGVRASLGLDDRTRLLGEALQSEDRRTDGRRRGALLAIERRLSKLFRAELGYRWADETVEPASPLTDSTAGATPNETNAVRARLTGDLPNRKGSAFIEFEQDVSRADQNRGAVGAEYWLWPRLRLYGRHEFLSSFAGPFALNSSQRLATTTVGFDLGYFKDGQFFSEYRARDAFAGREAEAVFGLRNRWRVARGVVLDGSFERVNPIRGTGVTEATAVTAGVEYTRSPLWRATARAEYRDAAGGDNFLATLGYARKLSRDLTFLGRGLWNALPGDQRRVRGQLGLAWRETDHNRWSGLARVEHGVDRLATGVGGALVSRQVEVASAHLNYQPILPLTLSAQYAGKWLRHDDGLETRTVTQLAQLRAIYDVDRNWDVGLQASSFWQGALASTRIGTGAELGRRLMRNLRVAAGYNVFGFRDQDLRETDYTLRGAYLRIDFKFDESLLGPGAMGAPGAGSAP